MKHPLRHDRRFGVLVDKANGGRPLIPYADIPDYMDDTFHDAVMLWSMYTRFGMPNGGGWLGERPRVLQAISIVDEEKSLFEAREMERRRKNHGNR